MTLNPEQRFSRSDAVSHEVLALVAGVDGNVDHVSRPPTTRKSVGPDDALLR